MKWDVLTHGLTSGATYDASMKDYYINLTKEYERAKRLLEEYQKKKREYEKLRKIAEEQKAKLERERILRLEKLKNETSVKEREDSAVRALEKWGSGETPTQREVDLFEISDYKKALTTGEADAWYEKAWRKVKDFFLSADGITATGWKMNDIQASLFSGNIAKSREDLLLLNMAEDYYKGNKTPENIKAIRELNRRKPGFLNSTAVYLNKALDWIGNNSVTGTTGAFLGTDELDKVRIGIDFDENTTSEQALRNIAELRNSYKALDEESYNAYVENHNKAKYYENLLDDEYKRKLNVAEGRIANENGVVDGSVEFFNFGKLAYQMPGIIAGSISSPSLMAGSFATGALTAGRILAATTAASAAVAGTGGWGAVAVPAIFAGLGAGATFGLNQAQGAHENAAEVNEGYVSKVKYALERHPKAAADFYEKGRQLLGKGATAEEIIAAKLINKIPSSNKTIDKVFDEASIGSQLLYDRDMVATTGDSTIDTALQITPLKFFTTLSKSVIKSNLRSSRIARAANKIGEKMAKLNGGDEGVLRKAFGKYGALVSGEFAAGGAMLGAAADNTLGRIPKINTVIKAMSNFDIAKIRRLGPKASNWLSFGGALLSRGIKSAISEGVEEGKQYYNQQRALLEFLDGLANGNLSFETQTILGDVLDDFLAGHFAAAGLVHAITGIPMLDYLHYTDTNIINAAEAIKNIKSGMVGGHGLTVATTAATGLVLTIGTSNAIDDLELAIRAFENNKLAAQKQFAQDLILSRTSSKHIAKAIEYLKNSDSIKLTDEELEKLQARAIEVRGLSTSKYTKELAKKLNIPKEDYHKFVADYMYHKDNLDAEGENVRLSSMDIDEIANKIRVESNQVANPSDAIAEKWSKNDIENERLTFENKKTAQVKKLQDHLKTLNDKLEKLALTNSQKAEVLEEISSVEESLKKAEESEFDESKKIGYALGRFNRINTLARIRGGVKQVNFLNSILSAMSVDNLSGREFVQKQIDETKKLLNTWLAGCIYKGRPLSVDNTEDIDQFIKTIATEITRADNDNMLLMGASAELSEQIEALSQAYQEHSNAILNYSIATDLFNKFLGYDVNERGEIVPEGTEGARHIRGSAKQHLEGIAAAQDDDAELEQAYQQGFAEYGYAGVYKDDFALVQDQEQLEELEKPGTIERRKRIKELGDRIRDLYTKTKNYVSGKWKSFGSKKIFIPDADDDATLDEVIDQLENDINHIYSELDYDLAMTDDAEKWLSKISTVGSGLDGNLTNGQAFMFAYYNRTKPGGEKCIDDNVELIFDPQYDRVAHVYYKNMYIGTTTIRALYNKANGDNANFVTFETEGFDRIEDLSDVSFLESVFNHNQDDEIIVEKPQKDDLEDRSGISEELETRKQVLAELTEKMNNKFDVSLRTSSHYFEWVGTGENRKLKLWHRLHDEIGSNFKTNKLDRKNWSNTIKKLYRIVYHRGYNGVSSDGVKDILTLLNYLQNYYLSGVQTEALMNRIKGYVLYLNQEGNDISDADLYECIKGISEEIAQEIGGYGKNKSLDRGTAMDTLCRAVFGREYLSEFNENGVSDTLENVILYCKALKMKSQSGIEVLVKDYFADNAFEDAISRIWNTRKVYEDDLGYVLWTSPFTIYTEDYTNDNGDNINIAGEVDMLAIDKSGRTIIIDFKTSKHSFFENGEPSTYFKSRGENIRSPQEQYVNLLSAYIEMLNETTRKETDIIGGFGCNEARILPIYLVEKLGSDLLEKAEIEFSKDLLLVLRTIPFKELGEKEGLIFDKESYRIKLAALSKLYARVDYIANLLEVYYMDSKNRTRVNLMREIKESLNSVLLALQDITELDLEEYSQKIESALEYIQDDYFEDKEKISVICKQYAIGELELNEFDRAHSYNNINWDNPLNDGDIDALGGFKAMGVKDREEYDKKIDELAHVSCNRDFLNNSTAKLTAVPYKTRQGNDKIAVYATITYNSVTYPPIRIYLAKANGEQFAKDVASGNTFGANIQTTIGLLSRCSDGEQHKIEENKQLVEAIGGTEENPYENFMVDPNNNLSVGVVYFNKTTGTLSTLSGTPGGESEVALPKTLKKSSANGHIVINIVPENSGSGSSIPIVCNTPKISEDLGRNKRAHRNQSLLEFLTETVLAGLNGIEGHSNMALNSKIRDAEGEELPLTYRQILDFFFEPYNSNNGDLVERPQYLIINPIEEGQPRRIQIGNFSKSGEGGAKIINLDDIKALKAEISRLSIWVSAKMASVKWNDSKQGSEQFNEFAKFLSKLQDGERFYLGNTDIYFDKSDANGTFLGFLAKNGLLTTPFNGFSHPLISINKCQKEDPTIPGAILPDDEAINEEDEQLGLEEEFDDEDGPTILQMHMRNSSIDSQTNPQNDPNAAVLKLQKGRSQLDTTAAREYVERVLGKQFVDNNLKFVDEICSAIVGGLSVNTIIAGLVTANMMKLSNYAENGTEYHEAFHWAFELIIDPKESALIRNIVRKKYGIVGEREIAEWLADTYMYYVRRVYTPKGNLLQKAFDKIKQWAITFSRIFTGEYQVYKLFNDINNGRFVNKPINNKAVLRFLEKFKELNSTTPTSGYERDSLQYKYQLSFTDHEENIKQLAFFILTNSKVSPAAKYTTNGSLSINVKSIFDNNIAKYKMYLDHYDADSKKIIKGLSIEQLAKYRESPKYKSLWLDINNALALRELVDDEHIDKTQEYVSAYIDQIIGVKGKDLSVDVEDGSSDETNMDSSYTNAEDGDYSSFSGSPKEHTIPDHQISRISKTSSRIKLFFATIPILNNDGSLGINKFGKYGYYDLHTVYQATLNKYYHVLSPEALWKAIEKDSASNPMSASLWNQISIIKKYAAKGNNNAIGLLNEIYKSIKSTKLQHEVVKTRYDVDNEAITYKSTDIMVLNNSFAISRDFTETVLAGFNKYFEPTPPTKTKNGEEHRGIRVRKEIYDERTDTKYKSEHRLDVLTSFFGGDIKSFKDVVEEIDKNTGKRVKINIQRVVPCLYDVIISYGTKDPKPLYIKDNTKRGYIEISVEKNAKYIKSMLAEALSAVGIDVTVDQIDDILETQFLGTGIPEIKQLLTESFALPARGNSHKEGTRVTLRQAVMDLDIAISSELSYPDNEIRMREIVTRRGEVKVHDGTKVFRLTKAHTLLSILLASAQQKKYEVSGRGVDGKLSYAMSDDNTVTAMCDAIFDKTNDPQCTKIRQMVLNDPFNVSNGTERFGMIPVGSFILPKIEKRDVGYEIVNDAGIETGNDENSSTNSDKRGADTIIAIITKLCQNMIVLAPFADKSTALGVRLHGIQIPGIDYDLISYSFRETGKEDDQHVVFKSYIQGMTLLNNGRVILGSKNNELDRTIASYVLAEYNLAKQAIHDYKTLLHNYAIPGSKNEVEEKYKTAFNICKKLMFMSQFSGDYVLDEETGEWTFKPFGVEKGSNKTDIEAAEEMLSQFESVVYDETSLLEFVNRHVNGLVQHELEILQSNGIIKKSTFNKKYNKNPRYKNILLDNNVITSIKQAIRQKMIKNGNKIDGKLVNELAIRVFIYDIVGKSIISKQESERLFTGQSDLYDIIRDSETRIITIPYQDLAKRIGSFVSTGAVGVVENEDYVCAEIPDDKQSIRDQVVRSIYMSEISGYIQTGGLNMSEHGDIDLRFATEELLKELIPKEFRPIVDSKVNNALRGFVLTKKNGSENKNNVTDGATFISAKFTKRLLKSQGAWNSKIAKAFDRLTSDKKLDVELILNDWEAFNEVWTQVIGTYKYTAVGFRSENVNGQEKVVQYVNKYALFPVFACICNEKMDAIRRQMDALNVDMLMFESAVKVGAHGNSDFMVDNNGNTTGHFNTYTQKQFFLRKQLNTDPNEKETMKIGIQTVKVALSAAIGEKSMEWRGELVDGDVIVLLIMDDIKKLADLRYDKLSSKLKTTKDVTNYVANFLRGNNVPERVVQEFLNGVPAEALSIQKHIDTLSAKRIQEDVVRINAPGSAFIQKSVYGVEGPNVKFGSLELNDGEELNVINADGSMDCVLSIDFFVEYRKGIPYFKLTPKGLKKVKLVTYDEKLGKDRPMSFEEIRKWLKSTGVIGKNARASILSYRIPTQAVASINALKCVDVIPVVRDTVVLPKLFTTITGADFDIDKLFMSSVWYSMEEQEDGSYKPVLIEDSGTEEGMSNSVVNDYIDILCATAKMHPEIFYQSIDQDTKLADDVIAWIKDLYPPTEKEKLYSASGVLQSMPSMQAKVHDEFLAGRQGIGPFALALVNHVLTRIYKVGFNSDGIYLRHKSLSKDTDDDGKSIMAWLSAMINKHVDVAKNPDITYLNVNDSTFNVVALLLRLGYGRSTFMFTCQDIMRDYAFAINQQTAVCKYTKNENGYNDPREDAYNEIVSKYNLDDTIASVEKHSKKDILMAACREIFDKDVDGKSLCEYVLEHHGNVPEGITIKIGNEDFKLTNLLFKYLNLELFNYLSDRMAGPLGELLQATVIDNERCITSMILSEFYKQAVAKIKESKVFYNLDKLFENSYIDNKIDSVTKIIDTIYDESSSMDKDVVTTVAKAIDPRILSYGKKRMNAFLSTVRDGMVAYFGAQFFDGYCKKNNIDRQALFGAGPKSIIRRLSNIQKSTKSFRGKYWSLRNNLLIHGLSIESIVGEEYILPEDTFYNKHRFLNYHFLRFKYAGQSDDNILVDVQQAWDELLNHPDKEIRSFARDLVVYSFYSSGEMSGNTKLFKYVPPSWRTSKNEVDTNDMSYAEFFKKVKANKVNQYNNIENIVDKLCRNLWYKDQFVRKISLQKLIKFQGSDILKSHKRTVADESGDALVIPDPIIMPIIAGIEYTRNGKVKPIFKGSQDDCPRYIQVRDTHHSRLTRNDDSAVSWVLYKLVGFKTYTDDQGVLLPYPIYVQTSVLGEKYYRNNIFEFNEELESNPNLDAYEITKEFIKKLGSKTADENDANAVIDNLIKLINMVNLGVNLHLTGDENDIAVETLDILVNKADMQTTFKPLNATDEFQARKQKGLEDLQDKLCNRD